MVEKVDRETVPVGKTLADQQRNAVLLSGYDYSKYPESITGYTGQDLQRIAFLRWEEAVRVRVGPRGNYKAGLTRFSDGTLVLVTAKKNRDPDPKKREALPSLLLVYESKDDGSTWQEIGETQLGGKEPSLTTLPDGAIVLTAEGPSGGTELDNTLISQSEDGGRTWETTILPGYDCPRNLIVEPDGTLLMVRTLRSGWIHKGSGSPNFQLCRSQDHGKTWNLSEGLVDWDCTEFGEISAIRLRDGRFLAAVRRQVPGTKGEGFEDNMLTESTDGGLTWSKPRQMTNNAEVHVYLTELADGRILATYANYHLPYGSFAIVSCDHGMTWDLEHPIQLSLSADIYVGWPATLQLPDGRLITSYASTTYYMEPPDNLTCEVVRWLLP
ncbi:MAG: sialidase family protein [Candidatus Latescibacterota bacterium]